MKTVTDLGKLVKEKYSEYRGLSDEEVGRLTKEKYPGSYDDFVDAALTTTSPKQPQEKKEVDIESSIDLIRRGDFKTGWAFFNRVRAKRALSRAEVINARNAINQALIESEQQVAQAKGAKFQSEHALALLQDQEVMRQALHQLETEQVKLKKKLTKQAAKRGLVVEVDQSLRLLEAQNELEITKVERLADSEQKRELEKMREEVRLALIAHHLTEHQKVTLIIEMLDLMYKQVQQIEDDSTLSDKTKQRMIEDREEFIISLKNDRKQREGKLSEDRLVQGGRQKGLQEGHEDSNLRGDYRKGP